MPLNSFLLCTVMHTGTHSMVRAAEAVGYTNVKAKTVEKGLGRREELGKLILADKEWEGLDHGIIFTSHTRGSAYAIGMLPDDIVWVTMWRDPVTVLESWSRRYGDERMRFKRMTGPASIWQQYRSWLDVIAPRSIIINVHDPKPGLEQASEAIGVDFGTALGRENVYTEKPSEADAPPWPDGLKDELYAYAEQRGVI